MKRLTIPDIMKRKGGEKLTMLTAYDASFARLLDSLGIDMILVGDSLGNVLLGYESTVPVTMEEMLHHAHAVRRGTAAFVVADMPFLSYQISTQDAVKNAGRFYKEAGSDAVKLEGGTEVCDAVRAIVRAGMAVMGHIGLTPQTAANLGGYKVQGKDAASARKILADAKALEEAGVFAIVMECIPDRLAKVITESVSVPTIGIGAGAGCDGQVLVTHDLLGMFDKFVPSFVKSYADLAPQIKDAVSAFKEEVRSGSFPDAKHSFSMQLDVDKLFSEER
jgi:3-methyl-2-oxobutanoate hydroxymethyltransferase